MNPIAPTVEPPPIVQAIAALFLLAVGLLALWRFRKSIFQTTLKSAWCWAHAALLAVAAIECYAASYFGARNAPYWLAGLRLMAGALTLCPCLSLMGAKRPQDLAWNWVVLALWALLALPVAVSWFRPTSTPLAAYGPLAYFLWLLIALNWSNFAATRYWAASLFLAAAQICYLSDHLPGLGRISFMWLQVTALVGYALAVLAAITWYQRSGTTRSPLDRVWLDFRDTCGLYWSLRLKERVNEVAVKLDWPVRLRWTGFVSIGEGMASEEWSPELARAVRQTMSGLLRRFVSLDWLAARWGK